jgi:hypothetical protein
MGGDVRYRLLKPIQIGCQCPAICLAKVCQFAGVRLSHTTPSPVESPRGYFFGFA